MKYIFLVVLLVIGCPLFTQEGAQTVPDERISTIDFVQILEDNREETISYYQNNWKVLRESAVKKGYIDSFQILEVPATDEAPFHFLLITTYANQEQYDLREDHFGELIETRGPLRLLNDKQPSEFRKVLFGKEWVRHWR